MKIFLTSFLLSLFVLSSAQATSVTHATNSSIEASGSPISSSNNYTPMTVVVWVRPTSNTLANGFGIGVVGSAANRAIIGRRDNTGAAIVVSNDSGSGSALADSSTGSTTLNTWYHLTGVFASTSSRTAYWNGGGAVSNTSTRTVTGANMARAGSFGDGATDFVGQIAGCALWSVALTAEEIASLAGGISPLKIRAMNLVFYTPYMGRDTSDIDVVGGRTFTNTNTSTSDEAPRVVR